MEDNPRIAEAQRIEYNALTYPDRRKREEVVFFGRKPTELEKLFGPGDPATGTIWADPLPKDFRPTPELESIVKRLQTASGRFVEMVVNLDHHEGYPYATYEGSGTYMRQWVERHTDYTMHHTKNIYGVRITVVFSHKGELPEYDEHDRHIGGTTVEQYNSSRMPSF